MLSKKEMDAQFGSLAEKEFLPLLNNFYGETYTKSANPMERFDFYNEKKTRHVELKARRIRHNVFDTAVVNFSKILNHKVGISYVYFWKYVDGWFYLPYDRELWTKENGFYVSKMKVERDGTWEVQDIMNIPRGYLLSVRNNPILPPAVETEKCATFQTTLIHPA